MRARKNAIAVIASRKGKFDKYVESASARRERERESDIMNIQGCRGRRKKYFGAGRVYARAFSFDFVSERRTRAKAREA